MKRVLFFFLSVFPALNLGTKCLQCSHSVDKPNEMCIEGKFSARNCPTPENSCLISMVTNVSAEDTGQEVSLSKFSRLCAMTKKEGGNCEVKDGVLKCYCNGDGCNDVPAKLLLTDKNKNDDASEIEPLNRILRQGTTGTAQKGATCTIDDDCAMYSDGERCIDVSPPPPQPPPPVAPPAVLQCQGNAADDTEECYPDVSSASGKSCAEQDTGNSQCIDVAIPGGTGPPTPEFKCKRPAASGAECNLKMQQACENDEEECRGGPPPTCQLRPPPEYEEVSTEESTPVEFWMGTHTWATYHAEHRECWNHSTIAQIIRGSDTPEKKKKLLEDNSCRLDFGLECLNITDTTTNPVTFKHACRCLLSFGPNPAIRNPANPSANGDDAKYGANAQCYIPAGKGYASECFASQPKPAKKGDEEDIQLPPYETFGFPLPFGDPAGIGPDPPQLTDTFFGNTEKEKKIPYLQWNTVYGRCPPNAECREAGTYIGKRCQCIKGALLVRSTGLCNHAGKMVSNPGLSLILISIILLLYPK